MTREDLAAALSTVAFGLFPPGQEDYDLSLDDVKKARVQVASIFDRAEHQVVVDAQLTAEDVADDIQQEELDGCR